MQVYLSRPGGQKEGPFTIAQLQAGQSRGLFPENEYWAWYEGLAEWVPLYQVPGLAGPVEPGPAPAAQPAGEQVAATAGPEMAAGMPGPAAHPEEPAPPAPAPAELSSGLPLAALEHLFVFATGDGQAIFQDEITLKILAEIAGADLRAQRQSASRDVVSRCKWVAELRRDGTVPENAWKVMTVLRPELVQQARSGQYKICVRTFPVGEQDAAALFLFYNKQMMPGVPTD